MRPNAALLVCALALACDRERVESSSHAAASPATLTPTPDTPAITPPTHRRCAGSPGPATTGKGFAHSRSALVAVGAPQHAVQDAVALPGSTLVVAAKIAYGDIGKDLEDEAVELRLDDCAGLRAIGRGTTDDDGIVRVQLTAPAQPGAYALQFVVEGDGTTAAATLHVLPAGTELVVFDIDGTLTTDDAEVTRDVLDEHFRHLADGSYVAEPYAHGAELAQQWARHGFVPVYLTGRPYWLVDHTRAWLAAGKYPDGIVHTTLRHRDVVPNVEGVGEFKAAFLRGLTGAGYRIAAAYGNASTDVWAYAQVGIATERTFIIGPNAGEGGTVAISGDWSAALPWARAHAAAQQPFTWPR